MLPGLSTIVLLLCSAPAAPRRQIKKHEPLISDIQFLVPLNNRGAGQHYDSQSDLFKGWKSSKNSKKHELADGPYSHIPDEDFTLDITGDIFSPPQKTVKKDLSRVKFIQSKTSEESNLYPRSSDTLNKEKDTQTYISRKCKLFLQRVESQSRYRAQSNENYLLGMLCKIYSRPSANGLDYVTSERDSRGKAWPGAAQPSRSNSGAGMLAGHTNVRNDPTNSFLSGIHMAGNNRFSEKNSGVYGNVVGGKARPNGQADSGRDNFIGYQAAMHNELPYSNEHFGEPTLIQIPEFGLAPQPSEFLASGHTHIKLGDIDVFGNLDQFASIDHNGLSEQEGRPGPTALQKFRPMAGRRQWLAVGGGQDNRLRQYISIKKPWLII